MNGVKKVTKGFDQDAKIWSKWKGNITGGGGKGWGQLAVKFVKKMATKTACACVWVHFLTLKKKT